ncbi:MAG TPA: hypothetical protein VF074_17830 [Pyrinomonadaceae bacterium]
MFDRPKVGQVVRWTARAISLLSTFVLLLFIFGEGEPFQVTRIRAVEWLGLLLFPVGVVVGFVVAWWREGLGGGITVVSLLAFYVVFEFLLNGKLTQGVWFFVFASPGFLFLMSWVISRSRRTVTAS